jgi:hypothetical protein
MIPWLPGGGAALERTAGDLRSELYGLLAASGSSDLVFWTDTELLEWINEGLARLARRIGVFVERDATTSVVGGTASYTLPTPHLSTIHVSLGTARLRPINVSEVEALSSTWLADAGTPTRYLQDGAGVANIRLYKKSITSGTLAIVEHELPDTVTATTELPLPDLASDYLTFFTLGEARRRESDAAMPEIAQFCESICGLYEQVFRSYWGEPQ